MDYLLYYYTSSTCNTQIKGIDYYQQKQHINKECLNQDRSTAILSQRRNSNNHNNNMYFKIHV